MSQILLLLWKHASSGKNTVDEYEIEINLFDDGKEESWDLKWLGFEDV